MRALLATCTVALVATVASFAAEFELAYIGPADGSALQGVRLGVEESNRQGEFLGVQLTLATAGDGEVTVRGVALFADTPGAVEEIAVAAGGRPVLNLSDTSDRLRAACLPNALHVIPSDAMMRDAADQWRAANPGQEISAAAWHHRAVKFAARDLNRRYTEQFGAPMDDRAWAGWFAARTVGDTLMRDPETGRDGLLKALKEADGLDGQKGDAQSFRASGQLRQPLVIVGAGGELLGEAPVRGAQGGLDSLGASPCE